VGHIDQPAVAQDESVLDDVLQLPDVPRKVVAHEDLHHRGCDSGDLLPPLRAETPDEMLDQKGDVLAPVPERGEGQTDDRQAEVQVVPELPVADELGQLPVGGRHDAHVRLHGLGPAERLVLALLEQPQKLDLGRRRQFAHLVKKYRPPFRPCHAPRLVALGVGKSPLEVPEQLGLEQIGGECPAVHHHVGLLAPRAQVMDRTGQQLFSRAAGPLDEHGRIALRDIRHDGEDLAERLALADHVLERVLMPDLAPELLERRQIAKRFHGPQQRPPGVAQHGGAQGDGNGAAVGV
jgi:hypothetical protein